MRKAARSKVLYPASRRKAAGFSLGEMVLAMSFVIFGLFVLMAMLPIALRVQQESISLHTQGLIFDSLRAEIQRTPFEEIIEGWDEQELYFDQEGQEKPTPGTPKVSLAARVTIEEEIVLPGDEGRADLAGRELAAVTIDLYRFRPGNLVTDYRPESSFTFLVAPK